MEVVAVIAAGFQDEDEEDEDECGDKLHNYGILHQPTSTLSYCPFLLFCVFFSSLRFENLLLFNAFQSSTDSNFNLIFFMLNKNTILDQI